MNTTKRYEILDITEKVEAVRSEARLSDGIILVSTMHITSSIFVNDHESGLWQDIQVWLEELAPAKPGYKHHLTGKTMPMRILNVCSSGIKSSYLLATARSI